MLNYMVRNIWEDKAYTNMSENGVNTYNTRVKSGLQVLQDSKRKKKGGGQV